MTTLQHFPNKKRLDVFSHGNYFFVNIIKIINIEFYLYKGNFRIKTGSKVFQLLSCKDDAETVPN